MTKPGLWTVGLILSVVWLGGCIEELEGGSCLEGTSVACVCPDGADSQRVCALDEALGRNTYSACQCADGNNGFTDGNNGFTDNNNGFVNNDPNNDTPNNDAPNNDVPNNDTPNNDTPDPDGQPPVIDALEISATTLRPDEELSISARVSDPQGAHTLFGGQLIDTEVGETVASFALVAPGQWETTLDWPTLNAVQSIDFGSDGSVTRTLVAVFTDLSGNEARSEPLSVTLRCGRALEGASNGQCALPQGPEVISFTTSRNELRPGQSAEFRATVRPDPDFPPGPLTAEISVLGQRVGALREGPSGTFTGTFSWEDFNRAAPLEYADADAGGGRSVRVAVSDSRNQRGIDSVRVDFWCADPAHIAVGGRCIGECDGGVNRCARFGSYGAHCVPDDDRCWWLADKSVADQRDTCNQYCDRIGLRCDDNVGFPDGYTGVLARCYGDPGCYASDRGMSCALPVTGGIRARLACVCVR